MKSRRKYLSKINVSDIVSKHFATLVNATTGKPSNEDRILFFFLPLTVALMCGITCTTISHEVANTIITILSIFVGLLINVIVLLFDIVKRDEENNKLKNVVLRETLTNISYTVLASLITIVLSILLFINNSYVRLISSVVVIFLMGHITITLLMIIKRMNALFGSEL